MMSKLVFASMCVPLAHHVVRGEPAGFGAAQVDHFELSDMYGALSGYNGGFTDDRFGYLVPGKENGVAHGRVARVDLNNFGAMEVLDLTSTDPDLKGFSGGFMDGQFGYLIPNNNDGGDHGKLVRFKLLGFGNVEVLDLADTAPDLKGFNGGFTDGEYGYAVPSFGKVVRFNLQSFGDVEELDLRAFDPNLGGKFSGGFLDGSFGYLTPAHDESSEGGKVARFDLKHFARVDFLDLTLTDEDLKGFSGGFTHGAFGYAIPDNSDISTPSGKVARFALQSFGGAVVLDLAKTDEDLKGFKGGFHDGEHGYMVPHYNNGYSSKVARFNLRSFGRVEVLDLQNTQPEMVGFLGGFQQGNFGYLIPSYSNRIARFTISGPLSPQPRRLAGGNCVRIPLPVALAIGARRCGA